METNKIYEGDALEVLKTFPDESVSCLMTSPPYWALRNYKIKGQLGLEKIFFEYIKKLCDIFEQAKRVLRKDGTCWVNIGDTYSATGWSNSAGNSFMAKYNENNVYGEIFEKKTMLEDKNLCLIPFHFAIEMQKRGWILRNVIIWHKPNCMPSSAKDRFTIDFEYLFFFVKNKKYWFETQYEPLAESTLNDKRLGKGLVKHKSGKTIEKDCQYAIKGMCANLEGRYKRAVWRITTKGFSEAHFAVYPEALCETPLKSGCPEFICNKCGKPREKIIKREIAPKEVFTETKKTEECMRLSGSEIKGSGQKLQDWRNDHPDKFLGYTDCGCSAGFSGGICLDPFFGAGTTGLVALKQNKQFIGIELNPEYIKIAERRLKTYLEKNATPTSQI